MRLGGSLVVLPLWGVSLLLYHTVVPFPPWVARTSSISPVVLMGSFGLGLCVSLARAAIRRPAWVCALLAMVARLTFLLGGLAVYLLRGRPDELAGLWGLFLLVSLRPPWAKCGPPSCSPLPE